MCNKCMPSRVIALEGHFTSEALSWVCIIDCELQWNSLAFLGHIYTWILIVIHKWLSFRLTHITHTHIYMCSFVHTNTYIIVSTAYESILFVAGV